VGGVSYLNSCCLSLALPYDVFRVGLWLPLSCSRYLTTNIIKHEGASKTHVGGPETGSMNSVNWRTVHHRVHAGLAGH
jgi:hypothetical protein